VFYKSDVVFEPYVNHIILIDFRQDYRALYDGYHFFAGDIPAGNINLLAPITDETAYRDVARKADKSPAGLPGLNRSEHYTIHISPVFAS
jgi:hypothetical protein